MDEYTIGKGLGMLIGGLIGIAIAYILLLFSRKATGGGKPEYDERQQIINGMGYKYAFKTMVVSAVVLLFLDLLDVTLPIPNSLIYYTMALIGILVHAGYGIMHDSYVAVNQKPGRVMSSEILFALCNFGIGFALYSNYDKANDSILSSGILNIECGIALLIGFLITGIKLWLDKASAKEDADEE